jgi:hypothetical protein
VKHTRCPISGKRLLSTLVLMLASLLTTHPAAGQQGGPVDPQAALASAFTYQGELRNAGGPVNDTCDLQFSLWDAFNGGSQVGATVSRPGTALADGLFIVRLDFGAAAFAGAARWLQVAVRCPAGSGSYVSFTPRQELTAAPYSLYAARAPWSGLGGVPAGFADGVDNDTTYSAGTGLSLSGGRFSVQFGGTGSVDTAARSDHGHWGASWSGSGTGLTLSGGTVGLSGSGSQYGLYGQTTSTSGRGLYGYASASSGATFGVEGTSVSNEGIGVWGRATAASGYTYGVYGYSSSYSGTGVRGLASFETGETCGVEGISASELGTGVLGQATSRRGYVYGVRGETLSPEGTGVSGWAGAGAGVANGVEGVSNSEYGTGVLGSGVDRGVAGFSASAQGVGGYFRNTEGGLALVAVSSTTNDILQVKNGANTVFRVNGAGNVHTDGGYHCGNNLDDGAGTLDENEIAPCLYDSSPADFAEMLPATQGLYPGEVLVVGPDGQLARSTQPYQSALAGVYSTRPSYLGNGQRWGEEGYAPLAMVGVVPVQASAENGPIRPGDLLTTSGTPGHAMKADPITVGGVTFYPSGVILGKALESLDMGTGLILALVTLQ